MQLVNILRNQSLRGLLGILLIAVFTIKSCDLFIGYYTSAMKACTVEKAEDESNSNPSENSFDKSSKKIYSCFEYGINFNAFTWVTRLQNNFFVYSFSIFKEPLRDVLTPPPNSLSFNV
jgi:hypothetical protein